MAVSSLPVGIRERLKTGENAGRPGVRIPRGAHCPPRPARNALSKNEKEGGKNAADARRDTKGVFSGGAPEYENTKALPKDSQHRLEMQRAADRRKTGTDSK